MSDNVRDELKKLLLHAYLLGGMDREKDYKGINVDSIASNFCEDVIAIFRKEGWMHPDDLVDGMVVKVIDESKLPLFRFDCGRHDPWEEHKYLAQGSSYCKECDKEHDEYNAMLKEKGFNWPPACPRPTHGKLIDEGGNYASTHPATVQDVLDKKAVPAC